MRLVVALVVIATACGKSSSSTGSTGSSSAVAPSSSEGSGSAAGSGDPWANPAAAADAAVADAPCDEDDIQRHIDASLKVSLAYLAVLESKARKWGKDCERAKKDLLALEPEATKFMASMQEFMTWGRALSPQCGKRVAELGERRPEARDIEARTPGLEAKVTPILERCKDHPGFSDAAAKGLRVMHTKKPSP